MALTAYEGMPSGICKLICDTPASDSMPEVDFHVTPVDAYPVLGLTDLRTYYVGL